jgi:hypothetical protein
MTKNVIIKKIDLELYKHDSFSILVDMESRDLVFNHGANVNEFTIHRNKIERISDDEYLWHGYISEAHSSQVVGDATFIHHKNDGITGSIDIEGQFYQIRPLGTSNLHAVVVVDQNHNLIDKPDFSHVGKKSESDSQINGIKQQIDSNLQSPIMLNNNRCSPEYVRALILYTPGASNAGNMQGIVSLAVSETQQAFANSGVSGVNILVQSIQEFNFNESGIITQDIDAITNNTQIQQLRVNNKADMVVMLTASGAYGGNKGIVSQIMADFNTAYAIVDVSQTAGPDYVFAHEVGHLFGAQHAQNQVANPEGPYSNSYGHLFTFNSCGLFGWSTCYRSTIMALPWHPNNPQTQYSYLTRKHFANPSITYGGAATGVAGVSEVHSIIEQSAPILADLVNPNELRTSAIMTFDHFTNERTFTAQPCGSTGSYTYEWRVSDDPFLPGSVVSTSSIYSNVFSEGTWFITLEVNSSSEVAYWSQSIYVEGDGGGDCSDPSQPCTGGALVNDMDGIPSEITLNSVYPNPFNPSATISFTVPSSQHVKISLFDMAGREVAVLFDGRKDEGSHRINLNGENLSSGNYMVRLIAGNTMKSQTISLIK